MTFVKTLPARLALVGLFVALVLLAANPLLKHAIIRSGESITGTRFTIGRVRSSYRQGYLSLHDCRAGHPLRPLHNLFEAETIVLEFDQEALSHRQMLVRRATVDGLRLGTRRADGEAGEIGGPSTYTDQLVERFARGNQRWFHRVQTQLAENKQWQFGSVRQASQIADQTTTAMQQLLETASNTFQRVDQLRGRLDEAGQNPLRNLESYLVAIAEAEQLGREIHELRGNVGRLEQQLMMDQETLVALRKADAQELERSVDLSGLNSSELTEYLLGPEVSSWVGEAISWVRWSRRFLPALGNPNEGATTRGEFIQFPSVMPRATVEIQNMVLRGSMPSARGDVSFEGQVLGLTSHPKLRKEPIELIVQTTSDAPLLVQARLHPTGAAEDEILVNLPNHPRSRRLLGDDQQFALVVPAGTTSVWMQMKLSDKSLGGQLVLKEQPVSLTMGAGYRGCGEQLSRLIDLALQDVKHIDVDVVLGGTLDHPTWEIESNLGPQLSSLLRDAVARELSGRHRESLAQATTDAQLRIAAISDQLATLKADVLDKLDAGAETVAQIKQTIASRVQATDAVVDPESPLREVFQR